MLPTPLTYLLYFHLPCIISNLAFLRQRTFGNKYSLPQNYPSILSLQANFLSL